MHAIIVRNSEVTYKNKGKTTTTTIDDEESGIRDQTDVSRRSASESVTVSVLHPL